MLNFFRFLLISGVVACGSGQGQRSHVSDVPDDGSDLRQIQSPARASFWAEQIYVYVHTGASEAVVIGLQDSLEVWNKALESQMLTFAGEIDRPRGDELYSSLGDDETVVYEEGRWVESTGKGPYTLGTTVWELSEADPQFIARGDILLNTEEYRFVDSTSFTDEVEESGGVVDAHTVLTHEIGHLLGLGHTDSLEDPESVMLPRTQIGYGKYHRFLSPLDIDKIKKLYQDESL